MRDVLSSVVCSWKESESVRRDSAGTGACSPECVSAERVVEEESTPTEQAGAVGSLEDTGTDGRD